MVNILQCNLGRDKEAHHVMLATAMKRNVDIVAVCEPNRNMAKRWEWIVDSEGDVAIFFRNRGMRVREKHTGKGYLTIEMEGWSLGCGYISPNCEQLVFESKVDEMMGAMKGHGRLALVGDFNAKSSLWGPVSSNERGLYLEEALAEMGMHVLNDGKKPTFIRGNSKSYIDLTCVTNNLMRGVRNWEVMEEETLTHHQYILFSLMVGNSGRKRDIAVAKPKNWSLFRELFEWANEGKTEAELNIEGFMKATKEAYRGCEGPTVGGRARDKPYWWTQEIHEDRERCLHARREITRAHNRRTGIGEDELRAISQNYRTLAKELRN